MTPAELEVLRLKARIEALLILVRTLYGMVSRLSPNGPALLRAKFQEMRDEYQQVALGKGVSPEISDLLTAEFQDAFADMTMFIEESLK